ncbi:MAG: deoxyribodipyrimidine photo-lyase [Myxococcaceae bacterium]
MKRTLVWFRGKDLRIDDHQPLLDAAAAGDVIPLFVLDPYFFAKERAAELPNRIAFLLGSLSEVADRLETLGSRLVVVEGRSVDLVPKLAAQWKVDQVFAHRWVEPFGRERDARVAKALKVPFTLYEGETLLPPGALRPFRVFTAFARAHEREHTPTRPMGAPKRLPPLPKDVTWKEAKIPTAQSLGLKLAPRLPEPGEGAAKHRLRVFVRDNLERYLTERDRMDLDTTSRLSVDLKFGTLSIRTVWHACAEQPQAEKFLSELRWREFSHHVLWHRPDVLQEPFQPAFQKFPWREDEKLFRAWTEGTTGYPVVDAAARQLLAEGFVHNRARMVAASFLAKHLMLDWRLGEKHYMKHLVDGDWAQNDLGWQWSAGCGCDAQPYFRVFNPTAQAERFDPDGSYVKRWVPRPVEKPIVDHAESRARFLAVAKQHLAKQRAQVR